MHRDPSSRRVVAYYNINIQTRRRSRYNKREAHLMDKVMRGRFTQMQKPQWTREKRGQNEEGDQDSTACVLCRAADGNDTLDSQSVRQSLGAGGLASELIEFIALQRNILKWLIIIISSVSSSSSLLVPSL